MEAEFCLATLQDALVRYGRPEIFNTDQDLQFTSFAFTNISGISMDGYVLVDGDALTMCRASGA